MKSLKGVSRAFEKMGLMNVKSHKVDQRYFQATELYKDRSIANKLMTSGTPHKGFPIEDLVNIKPEDVYKQHFPKSSQTQKISGEKLKHELNTYKIDLAENEGLTPEINAEFYKIDSFIDLTDELSQAMDMPQITDTPFKAHKPLIQGTSSETVKCANFGENITMTATAVHRNKITQYKSYVMSIIVPNNANALTLASQQEISAFLKKAGCVTKDECGLYFVKSLFGALLNFKNHGVLIQGLSAFYKDLSDEEISVLDKASIVIPYEDITNDPNVVLTKLESAGLSKAQIAEKVVEFNTTLMLLKTQVEEIPNVLLLFQNIDLTGNSLQRFEDKYKHFNERQCFREREGTIFTLYIQKIKTMVGDLPAFTTTKEIPQDSEDLTD